MTTSPVTIYAVHRCEHEDSSIKALFATRELADRHAVALNAKYPGGFEVDEYPLLDVIPVQAKTFLRSASVNRTTGKVGQEHRTAYGEWDYERPPEIVNAVDHESGWTTIHAYAHSAERADELLTAAIVGKVRADV